MKHKYKDSNSVLLFETNKNRNIDNTRQFDNTEVNQN